jgi:hypothetical protein
MNDLIERMTPTAAQLACAVSEMDTDQSQSILGALSRDELQALAVVLAAVVDVDAPFGNRPEDETKRVVRELADVVGERLGVDFGCILSKSRQQEYVAARQIVCWIALADGHRCSHIGRALGRDHATVLHSAEKVTATPHLLAIARSIHDEMKGLAA